MGGNHSPSPGPQTRRISQLTMSKRYATVRKARLALPYAWRYQLSGGRNVRRPGSRGCGLSVCSHHLYYMTLPALPRRTTDNSRHLHDVTNGGFVRGTAIVTAIAAIALTVVVLAIEHGPAGGTTVRSSSNVPPRVNLIATTPPEWLTKCLAEDLLRPTFETSGQMAGASIVSQGAAISVALADHPGFADLTPVVFAAQLASVSDAPAGIAPSGSGVSDVTNGSQWIVGYAGLDIPFGGAPGAPGTPPPITGWIEFISGQTGLATLGLGCR